MQLSTWPWPKKKKGTLQTQAHARLAKLNADLLELTDKSKEVQNSLVLDRADAGVPAVKQNLYQKGDFVLFDQGSKVHPKMAHRYTGPFEVKKQSKNDVHCQHMATGEVITYDV